MYINSYNQLLKRVQNKLIVVFGIGKMFNSYKYILEEKDLREKILAFVDNDIKKHGTKIDINGKYFSVLSFEELADRYVNNEILILVTAACFNEIQRQIKNCKKLCGIEILDARYALQKRGNYLASYSNIFSKMNTDIGKNGENMTVSILMHNRAQLTIRLIESMQEYMPFYKGEILIGDNGSAEEECIQVEQKMNTINFRWRIHKLGRHYPIPIGKNRLNMKCETDWIMQLDNDVYFIDNPLKKINEAIDRLGCQIWGFPYYNTLAGRIVNYGSNLEFVNDEKGQSQLVCLRDLSFQENQDIREPMLCTYTSGGASLMRKKFFEKMGGYDENIYINEDVELAYRINMEGYKIGNIGMVCLVHDHKQIDSELGRQYEAMRFDDERIKKSKEYLKAKYGIIFA